MRRAQISATYFVVAVVGVLWLYDVQMPERDEPAAERKDIIAEKQFMWKANQVKRLGFYLDDQGFQQCAVRRVKRYPQVDYDEWYCNGELGRFAPGFPVADSMNRIQHKMVRVVDSLAIRKGYVRY